MEIRIDDKIDYEKELIGLDISEARDRLGYWYTLESYRVTPLGGAYFFERVCRCRLCLYTDARNIVNKVTVSRGIYDTLFGKGPKEDILAFTTYPYIYDHKGRKGTILREVKRRCAKCGRVSECYVVKWETRKISKPCVNCECLIDSMGVIQVK